MQGWQDAAPMVKTPYTLLLHNDGYALDDFFGCELLQSLKHAEVRRAFFRCATRANAWPMLIGGRPRQGGDLAVVVRPRVDRRDRRGIGGVRFSGFG